MRLPFAAPRSSPKHTIYNFFQFTLTCVCGKDENKQKRGRVGPFKKKKNKNLFSSSKVLFSESFYEATFSRIYLREDILCLDRCSEVIWIRALLPHKLCVATIERDAASAFTNQGNVFLSPSTHRR